MPSSNELKILDLIAEKPAGSQRDFASASGFSLGLTNAILKRLAMTGYIKIQNLNARKMRYMLTPKGLSEKSRRTIDYITNTIKTFHTCLNRVKAALEKEIADGKKHFIIIGEGNIAELTELALKELGGGITFEKAGNSPVCHSVLRHGIYGVNPKTQNAHETVVLDCRFDAMEDGKIGISMLSKLLEIDSHAPRHAA
ncbi:MAG: winged helix-turn-helix transcriptional regulator [Elusimicrobia bacterium]|nr:winged helix-turn-helix transcriptional regulator [Elusimicrobiota bacterium]